jgi:hypothetical protein
LPAELTPLLNAINAWTGPNAFSSPLSSIGGISVEALPNFTVTAVSANGTTATLTVSSVSASLVGATFYGFASGLTHTGFNTATTPVLFTVASQTTLTFSLAVTQTQVSDSGTVTPNASTTLNQSGGPQSWVTAAGQIVVLTSSGQPLVIANAATLADALWIYQNATSVFYDSKESGAAHIFRATNTGGSADLLIVEDLSGNVFLQVGSGSSVLLRNGFQDFSSTVVASNGRFYANTGYAAPASNPDTSLYRSAANTWSIGSGGASGGGNLSLTAPSTTAVPLTVNLAASATGDAIDAKNSSGTVLSGINSSGFIFNWPGRKRVTTSVTNSTNSLGNILDLTISVLAGHKYSFKLVLFAQNSTAAEGLQFDLNGGTATMTSIEFGLSQPAGSSLVLGTVVSTSLGTDLTITTATTSDTMYTICGEFVVNAAGTIIPRFAENSTHISGTAQVTNGYFWVEDSPN